MEALKALAPFAVLCAPLLGGCRADSDSPQDLATPPGYEALETAGVGESRLPRGALDGELEAWRPDTIIRASWVDPTDVEFRNGRTAVADPDGPRVYLFPPDGSRIGIGQRGQGPGEFMSPRRIAISDESVWVLDGRITRWDWTGTLQETVEAVPIMTADLLIEGDSLAGTLQVGDQWYVDAWAEARRGLGGGDELGAECGQLGDGFRPDILLDCRRGALVVLDSVTAHVVELGHSGSRMTPEERDRITQYIAERVGEVGYSDPDVMGRVVMRQVERFTHKDMWRMVTRDEVTGSHLLVFQEPVMLSPTTSALLVVDRDLALYRTWRLPGAVVDLAADDGSLAALIRDPETGVVGLARGRYDD